MVHFAGDSPMTRSEENDQHRGLIRLIRLIGNVSQEGKLTCKVATAANRSTDVPMRVVFISGTAF